MSLYLSTGFEPADSTNGLTGLTRSPLPSPWIVGRAEDLATDDEKARAAEATPRLEDVAFRAETARKSVLDARERAAMVAITETGSMRAGAVVEPRGRDRRKCGG